MPAAAPSVRSHVLRDIGVFLFLWLLVGFSVGTSVLIGPVRWVTEAARSSQWPAAAENAVVIAIILVYVGSTAALSAVLAVVATRSPHSHVRAGLPGLAVLAAAGALWLWMNPAVMGADVGEVTEVGSSFTFGPYPTAERMTALQEDGYTAVITLLHPAVVPFEPKLLADEREAARAAGIELIHAPMLPWVGNNRESIREIEHLARNGAGRYYVHCYLGRDRVHVVRSVVERVAAEVSLELDSESEARSVADRETFERGRIYILDDDVYLTPYPTDEEFLAFLLGGNWGTVVSLMDPANPDDLPWIEKEREILERYRIPFRNIPLSHGRYDPDEVLSAAREVWGMDRPVLVHHFLSPSTGKSAASEAFLQAFRSNLPPLAPTKFRVSMTRGKPTVVAPNLAVGPRPTGPEFGSWLFRRGIRGVLYLGDPGSEEATLDRAAASEAPGLEWRAVPEDDDSWIREIETGGPWYVYGPGLSEVETRLARRLGPAVPERIAFDPAVLVADRAAPVEGPRAGEDPRPTWSDPLSPERWIPPARTVILLWPVVAILGGLAAWLAGWLRTARQWRTPYTRKVFHFIIFTLAGAFHLAGGLHAVVVFGTVISLIVLYAVYRGDGFPHYESMARPTDEPHRTLFILIPLGTTAVGGVLANVLFPAYAYVGYLVGGWGDAVGEPVGTRWGNHPYRVPSLAGVPATRSLEGSAAVLCTGVLAAFLGLVVGGISPLTALGAALLCGIAGAVVEAISNHGLDNLTIQVVAAGTAWLLLS
jgi:phytol kinase